MILPLGEMVGGHVTAIDHQYYVPIDFQSAPDTYEVFSAIVPDPIDLTTETISIGRLLPDQDNQFGILGNVPDPAQLGVETGLVVYELI